MRKAIFLVLVFISIVVLIIRYGSGPVVSLLNLEDKAGVRVQSNIPATVYINGKEVGSTPYEAQDLKVGDHLVELKNDKNYWSSYIGVNSGTLTVVNRELVPNESTSSGEIISLKKGKGVMILSNPNSSDIEVDQKYFGKTPLAIADLKPGEYLFVLSHPNYLKRSIRAVVAEGYQLNLNVDLAISEPDLTQISTIPIKASPKVVVKQTSTGFLRVRSGPSTASTEVGRVAPGDELTLLEEVPNWIRVKLPNGKEGYVSSSFVEKKE